MRFRPDGNLEFGSRFDSQVKIRGLRVELGEIEAALRGLAGVSDAIVVAREDVPGDRRLVAYVVADARVAQSLREPLAAQLPGYMVPAVFVALDRLPLTVNGKVDRKALPAPGPGGSGGTGGLLHTPTEELLAAIWAELLRLERVGSEDGRHAAHPVVSTRSSVTGAVTSMRSLAPGSPWAKGMKHVPGAIAVSVRTGSSIVARALVTRTVAPSATTPTRLRSVGCTTSAAPGASGASDGLETTVRPAS